MLAVFAVVGLHALIAIRFVEDAYTLHDTFWVSMPPATGVGAAYTLSPAFAPVTVMVCVAHVELATTPNVTELVAERCFRMMAPALIWREPFIVLVPAVRDPVDVIAVDETLPGKETV